MIAEQLRTARLAHWRQNRSPLLTLEDAERWLERHPLCLFVPRRAQLPAPAPSFVEACHGESGDGADPAALERARDLLIRLTASGAAIALNLLGGVGEQPDFVVGRDAFPFVLALRGDRHWQHAPLKSGGHKISPLVAELWKVLGREGALTVLEARETLGRELTEGAVLRALNELWQSLRAVPVPQPGGLPARWELVSGHHRQALGQGAGTSQVTAISLLVSVYLQSVYAATGPEIEIFLSPLASRSRVREAVRGLSATQQIHSLSLDSQTYYFLEGGLPEMLEPSLPEGGAEASKPVPVSRRQIPGIRAPRPGVSQPAWNAGKGTSRRPAAKPVVVPGGERMRRPGKTLGRPAASGPTPGSGKYPGAGSYPRFKSGPKPAFATGPAKPAAGRPARAENYPAKPRSNRWAAPAARSPRPAGRPEVPIRRESTAGGRSQSGPPIRRFPPPRSASSGKAPEEAAARKWPFSSGTGKRGFPPRKRAPGASGSGREGEAKERKARPPGMGAPGQPFPRDRKSFPNRPSTRPGAKTGRGPRSERGPKTGPGRR